MIIHKKVILLVGCSGSGKSTLADIICRGYGQYDRDPMQCICSADDFPGYYNAVGEYVWTPEACNAAHAYCQDKFKFLIEYGSELIIVDNTNLTAKARRFYADAAKQAGYEVQIIAIEPQRDMLGEYAKRNKHGLTLSKIKQQYDAYVSHKHELYEAVPQ